MLTSAAVSQLQLLFPEGFHIVQGGSVLQTPTAAITSAGKRAELALTTSVLVHC